MFVCACMCGVQGCALYVFCYNVLAANVQGSSGVIN